jgi:hypothetical protein
MEMAFINPGQGVIYVGGEWARFVVLLSLKFRFKILNRLTGGLAQTKPNQTIFWARFYQMVWAAKKWFYGLVFGLMV